MSKIKLPRKRKKAYIKAKGKPNYIGLQILIEMLFEEGRGNNRFYSYRECKTKAEYNNSKNGYTIAKKW